MTAYISPIAPSPHWPSAPEQGDTLTVTTTGDVWLYDGIWSVSSRGNSAADWAGNRSDERWEFRVVSWSPGTDAHLSELGEYGNIVSASIELSALSDLKATGELSFKGGEPPQPDSLVRAYYSFTDDAGRTAGPVAVATLSVNDCDPSYAPDSTGEVPEAVSSGTVGCDGLLCVLSAKKPGVPYPVAAGENPIRLAVALIEDAGLRTNSPDIPEASLSQAHLFEPDDSYLAIANWLLTNSSPRYSSLRTDAYGMVMVEPYTPPEKRPSVFDFVSGEGSIMYPDLSESNGWAANPNVARFYYEGDGEALSATATLLSGAKWALEERGGREHTLTKTVSELTGETIGERRAALEAMALSALTENGNEIEHVSFSHAYVPEVVPNAAVGVSYADRSWSGNVMNMKIDCSPASKCRTEIRRFVANEMVFNTSSEVLWQT